MTEKITQLKPKNKEQRYHIVSEGNANPLLTTYDVDSAKQLRDQLEDTHRQYLTSIGHGQPLANRYTVILL
jgi:hypothetical protein